MKNVIIHSDGGCSGNPGPGGWAAILTYGKHTKELSDGEPATTNNRMELRAAIEALNALKEPCEVEFFTDSEYVRQGVTKWMHGWKRKGWKRGKKPLKNDDLWRALDAATAGHKVTWRWLRGHAGHEGNERCDFLATEAISRIRREWTPEKLSAALAEFVARAESVSEDEAPDTTDLLTE